MLPDRCTRWDEYRPMLLKIGLAMSISASIVVLNITTEVVDEPTPLAETEEIFIIEDAPRTDHEKKETPPPKKEKKIHKKELAKTILVDIIKDVADSEEVRDSVVFQEPELTNDYAGSGDTPSKPAPIVAPIEEPESNEPLNFVEYMPSFGDCYIEDRTERKTCSDQSVLNFLSKKIKYPTLARENGITGTVVVRFVVSKDGSVTDCEIARDIGGGCGNEALRVIKAMPNWSPGKQNGRPVNVYYTLPVKFSLQ